MPTQRPTTIKGARSAGITPLGIIATFVALSETVAGLAAIKTGGDIQLLFAVFAVLFPVFIASVFFVILWKRSYVLYPPQEFGAEVDVRHYVEAMRNQALGATELHALVRTAITETLESQTAQVAISRMTLSSAPAGTEALREASEVLVHAAVDRLQSSVITIDVSAFGDAEIVPDLVFPYDPHQDAFVLLSAVYYQISDHVRPFTYGRSWALKNRQTGELILPTSVRWTDNYALADSGATVEQFGLHAGMTLSAVPLDDSSRITQRGVNKSNRRGATSPAK